MLIFKADKNTQYPTAWQAIYIEKENMFAYTNKYNYIHMHISNKSNAKKNDLMFAKRDIKKLSHPIIQLNPPSSLVLYSQFS